MLDVVERERTCKSLVDIIPNQLEEEFWLLRCTLVVFKCKGVIDVVESV